MKIPSVADLSNIVDTAKLAVDESSFGPLFHQPDPNNVLDKKVNNLAFSVFTIVLTGLIRDMNKGEGV